MTALLLLVALGAGGGSAVRFLVASRLDTSWPLGTFAVNVVGSALAGAGAALLTSGHAWSALLVVGFCGGLTTWSGLAVQVHDLGWRAGTTYAVATLACSLAGCALVWTLARGLVAQA